jgi:hypothetical protein
MIIHINSLQNMVCKLKTAKHFVWQKLSTTCRGVVNLWFKSNLSNRKQCIEVNYMESTTQVSGRYTSDLKEIKHSIPQGSFLGLMFLLHVKIFQLICKGQRWFCLLIIQISKYRQQMKTF